MAYLPCIPPRKYFIHLRGVDLLPPLINTVKMSGWGYGFGLTGAKPEPREKMDQDPTAETLFFIYIFYI